MIFPLSNPSWKKIASNPARAVQKGETVEPKSPVPAFPFRSFWLNPILKAQTAVRQHPQCRTTIKAAGFGKI